MATWHPAVFTYLTITSALLVLCTLKTLNVCVNDSPTHTSSYLDIRLTVFCPRYQDSRTTARIADGILRLTFHRVHNLWTKFCFTPFSSIEWVQGQSENLISGNIIVENLWKSKRCPQNHKFVPIAMRRGFLPVQISTDMWLRVTKIPLWSSSNAVIATGNSFVATHICAISSGMSNRLKEDMLQQ